MESCIAVLSAPVYVTSFEDSSMLYVPISSTEEMLFIVLTTAKLKY